MINSSAEEKYKDIINLPHHVSKTHIPMSLEARAAQFAPFAALTGFEEEIEETGRLTDSFVELTEDEKSRIDMKLAWLNERITKSPEAAFTYFVEDKQKAGGEYRVLRGCLKKIDVYGGVLIMTDGTSIPIKNIIDINLEN